MSATAGRMEGLDAECGVQFLASSAGGSVGVNFFKSDWDSSRALLSFFHLLTATMVERRDWGE